MQAAAFLTPTASNRLAYVVEKTGSQSFVLSSCFQGKPSRRRVRLGAASTNLPLSLARLLRLKHRDGPCLSLAPVPSSVQNGA